MKELYNFILVNIMLITLAHANQTGSWYKKIYQDGVFSLPYQIFLPNNSIPSNNNNYSKNSLPEKFPLVIYLHGTGEAGSDNEKQLYKGQNIGADYFSSNKIQQIQKAFVLAPQTPVEIRWASTSLAAYKFKETPPTQSMVALLKLIDQIIAENPVDIHRIYLLGLSRGGQGVWYAAMLKPHLFAAIVPIAGSSDIAEAELLRGLPIWVFHGNADKITPVIYSRNMVTALQKLNFNKNLVKYTEIPNGNHESAWLKAHEGTYLWQWLLQQKTN